MTQRKENSLIPQNRANDIAVEQVTFFDDMVSIDYYLPEWNMTKELIVYGKRYGAYLKDIEALNWSFKVYEGSEYVNDKEGEMTLSEYFADVDFQQRNKDAVSYLKAHHVDHEGLPDIFGAIAAIAKPAFPNKDTYPVQAQKEHEEEILASMPAEQIHEAHAAMFYGNAKNL